MLTIQTRSTFHTLHDAAVLSSESPDAPAIIYLASDADPIYITRAVFRAHAMRYASALKDLGIVPRDLIIIADTQSLGSIYAFWGALLLGAIPSMFPTLTEKLDPAIYRANMAELVRLSNVRAVLTNDAFAPELAAQVGCPVYGSSAFSGDQAPLDINSTATPDDIAFLQHSSGTTGLQKGVTLSHASVLNQLASYANALSLNVQDVIVSWLPLYHDMGLIAGFMQPLVQGIPLVLMSPFDWVAHPAMLLRAIQQHRGTLCWLPNFAYNHLAMRVRAADSEGIDLSTMRAFINCSEPVRHDSHLKFAERFAANGVKPSHLTVSYAMAENTFAVTQTPIGTYPAVDIVDQTLLQSGLRAAPVDASLPTAAPQVSCGKPIYNTAVKVVDADGSTVPDRCVGELMVKSDCMLSGYYHRADLHPFDADGWYKTGDRGYMSDGEVYVIGRSKDLIINAGKNVYPQDIEAILNDIPGVHPGRAVVFGVADAREGTELIAAVAEVDTDDPTERKKINQAIRQNVARRTEITLSYVALVEKGWLIKTSSGKIARGANRDKWKEQFNIP